ncbi:MAG: GDP-L-fucose synthase [Bacteroidales bacterium]|jgi:GDP-L-fucose synthase|nr:GDP-L-fucose synthase [Bacteroidales bacterium]
MNKNSKIYIAGHKGMVGSAVFRLLQKRGFTNLLVRSLEELDLRDQRSVNKFFSDEQPEYVILAAAKVGGINANMNHPAEFLYDNLQIQNNIIHQSWLSRVKKLVFLGSSCIYPRESPQPMKEEYLMSGKLEPTNEGYAIAKIAGLKMCEYYYRQYGFECVSVMPCNLYGPNDSFDLQNSHVLSALVKRFCDAAENKQPELVLWGSGIARREFMHVDDAARAIVHIFENYRSPEFINIGWGVDITVKELAEKIAQKTGYTGTIEWDNTKPDGMLRKCLDVSRMKALNFNPEITLSKGIDQMIDIYKQTHLKK